MTDGQPGQDGVQNNAAQDAEFDITFDDGTHTDDVGGNTDNTEGTDNGNTGDNPDATATDDAFEWVPADYREEFKNNEELARYTTSEDFIKAVLDDRKVNGNAIKIPGEDATEEDWNKFYNKLGRPENAEGYGLSKELPEGLDFSEDMYNGFIENIHKAGLTKKQAEGLYKWYNDKTLELNKEITARMQENYQKSVNDAVANLKKEWGTDYQDNLNSAVAMANKFLSPATKQYLNATKLGNNPLLIKDFYKLSQQVSGAQMKGDGPSGAYASLSELEAKLEKNLRAMDYTTNKALQQENKEIAEKIAQMQSKE